MRQGEKLYIDEINTNNAIYFMPPETLCEPEIFLPITDQAVPGVAPYYLISNYGRIWHRYKQRFLTVNIDTKGYLYKPLAIRDSGKSKSCRIHRLVMMTFAYIPGCENLLVNHKDGNKGNCHLYNLEWSTSSENQIHAVVNGLKYRDVYTDEQIHHVCRLLEDRGKTLTSIAEETGVQYTTIQAIQGKRAFLDISDKYNIKPRKINNNLSIDQIHQLCDYYQNNPKLPLPQETLDQYSRRALIGIGIENPSSREIRSAKKVYTKESYSYISCEYDF